MDEAPKSQPLISDPTPKLCVNCRFIATSVNGWQQYKCMHPNNKAGINLVSGDFIFNIPLCVDQRNGGLATNICGKEGKWYEHRPSMIPKTNDIDLGGGRRLVRPKITADDL